MADSKLTQRARNHETDDEEASESAPSKKAKVYSARKQKFINKYSMKYKYLHVSSNSDTSAHCTICHIDFLVGHGGLYDCKRHDESESHQKLAVEKEKSRPTQNIRSFLVKPEPVAGEEQLQRDVTRAEAMICNIIVDNNLSLSCSDVLTKAVASMLTC